MLSYCILSSVDSLKNSQPLFSWQIYIRQPQTYPLCYMLYPKEDTHEIHQPQNQLPTILFRRKGNTMASDYAMVVFLETSQLLHVRSSSFFNFLKQDYQSKERCLLNDFLAFTLASLQNCQAQKQLILTMSMKKKQPVPNRMQQFSSNLAFKEDLESIKENYLCKLKL